jgi:multidrug transporter EmrE-like cation transporter
LNIFAKYSLIFFVSAIGISGQILLKKGLRSFSDLELSSFLLKISVIVFQPVILLALLCYVIGIIAYLFLLSKVELTSVYPICTSLTFGGITFFGWLLLNEPLSWPKISGIILIIIGIFLIERFG